MKPLQIGITGGIGSGKTVVCKALEVLGYPVFDADTVAKEILETANVSNQVKAFLGDEAYFLNGKANREWIASRVFDNSEKLSKLNGIIHPAVQQQYHQWVENYQNVPLVFKEAAIMFESGSYKEMDKVIAITAPLELRVSRIIGRDGKTPEQIMQIVNKQLPEEDLVRRSDFVIINDDHTPVLPQLLVILQNLTKPTS